MKSLACFVISVICYLHVSIMTLSYAGEPVDTATLYLEALREGDTEEIITYLGGKLYQKRKVLLEENASYSELLRSHYQGVVMSITGFDYISPGRSDVGVDVEFRFANGDRKWARLILVTNSLGEWKIVDETDINQ